MNLASQLLERRALEMLSQTVGRWQAWSAEMESILHVALKEELLEQQMGFCVSTTLVKAVLWMIQLERSLASVMSWANLIALAKSLP